MALAWLDIFRLAFFSAYLLALTVVDAVLCVNTVEKRHTHYFLRVWWWW